MISIKRYLNFTHFKVMKKLFLPVLVALSITASAQVKIGDNPTSIGASSVLELESANKAFLITRVDVITSISSPVNGMIVFDNFNKCIRAYEQDNWGSCISGFPMNPYPSGVIPGNTTTSTKAISKTPCSAVAGATLNDYYISSLGIEYDWAYATDVTGVGYGSPSTVRAIVDISGQCWASYNSTIPPSTGYSGYGGIGPNNYQAGLVGGLLYSYTAATTSGERGRGACPVSWHVPSDAEWMFLENSIGMDVAKQQILGGGRITTGQEVTDLLFNGQGRGSTNRSGFNSRYPGYGQQSSPPVTYVQSYNDAYYWTSTLYRDANGVYNPLIRSFGNDINGVTRSSSATDFNQMYSVRCLKD